MKADSENEGIIKATATSKVSPGDYYFKVIQLASSDTFRSDVIERTRKLPELKFEILFKDKTIPCHFRGGTIDALAQFLNERAEEILRATVLKIDDRNAVLNIEGKETGEESRLVFKGNLEPLEDIGLLRKYTYSDFDLNLTDPNGLGSDKPYSEIIKEGSLYLPPVTGAEKLLATPQKGGKQVFLKFKIKIQDYRPPETVYDQMEDVQVGTIDKVWVGDVDIQGEPMLTDPNFGQQFETKAPDSKNLLIINYQRFEELVEFPYNPESNDWQEITIELKDDYINRLSLNNPFSNKEIYFKDMKIVDEKKKGFIPKNSITRADDSIVEHKGVKISRATNSIDDLVPGMNLMLEGTSDKKVKINVDWNYEGIKKKIFEFIVMYNNAMDYIKNVTKIVPPKNQKQTTRWRKSFEDMSGEEAEKKAQNGSLYEGILNGDMTVSMIKTKIRSVITRPYDTKAEEQVRFVTQIGIKNPKYTSSGTEEERENLRAGYFEFNETEFDSILQKHYEAVQQLFFQDTNEDMIYDNGLAVEVNDTLQKIASESFRGKDGRVYSGMIKSKVNMLDNQIKMRKEDIARFEKHMKEYEQRLREKFARMYRAFKKAEAQQSRLQGFGSQNK
jgi:flagellar hook-associated protein 2